MLKQSSYFYTRLEQLSHLKYVSERHGPVGDAVDKHCLQDPLDVVEGVAHAGQAAKSCTCIYSTCSSDHGDHLALFCIIQERS